MSADVRSRWGGGWKLHSYYVQKVFTKVQSHRTVGGYKSPVEERKWRLPRSCNQQVATKRQISVKWDEDTQLIMMRTAAADSTKKKLQVSHRKLKHHRSQRNKIHKAEALCKKKKN